MKEIADKFGDPRRTEIIQDYSEFNLEDMIAEEDMLITISHTGYIKRFPVSGFRRQGRGGKGLKGAESKEEDFIRYLFVASTHNYILFFTNKGRCYWLKVHEIPQMGRASKGKAIVNLINIEKDEQIAAFVNVDSFTEDKYIVFCTKKGLVKRTALMAYSNPRRDGIWAISLYEGDELIEAKITDINQDIILATREGKAVRFPGNQVRSMGRTAAGVKGITIKGDNEVVGMVVVKREGTLLVISRKGYGKRSSISDYPVHNRGGQGVITLKTTDRIGEMIALMEVLDEDDLMIITAKGLVIRQNVGKIRTIGRITQGVRLIRINEDDWITDIARVVRSDEEDEEDDGSIPPDDITGELFG